MKELTSIQKEKIQTLLDHARKDIDRCGKGTYRKLHTMELDRKAITKAEAAIKLLEEIIF